jgi:hypothetical protein
MPGLSNYPPGVSGNEPQITGGPDPDDPILIHHPCGARFDDITLAGLHGLECKKGSGDNDDWSIGFMEPGDLMGRTPKTDNVITWMDEQYPEQDVAIAHTQECDQVSTADECIGGCRVEYTP